MDQNLSDILNFFEHMIIPDYFFDEGINLIADLNENHDLLFKIFCDICRQEKVANPYTEKDFSCDCYKMDNTGEWFGAKLHFPSPIEPPHCYEMYLFFDSGYERKGCYTLEYNTAVRKLTTETKTPDGKIQRNTILRNENCGILCSWTREHVHNNYGSHFFDQGMDFYGEAFKVHIHKYGQ